MAVSFFSQRPIVKKSIDRDEIVEERTLFMCFFASCGVGYFGLV